MRETLTSHNYDEGITELIMVFCKFCSPAQMVLLSIIANTALFT